MSILPLKKKIKGYTVNDLVKDLLTLPQDTEIIMYNGIFQRVEYINLSIKPWFYNDYSTTVNFWEKVGPEEKKKLFLKIEQIYKKKD